MRRFKFNLQALLDLRQNEEQRVQSKLAKATQTLVGQEREKQNQLGRMAANAVTLGAAKEMDIRLLKIAEAMNTGVRSNVKKLDRKIEESQRVVGGIQTELTQASVKKKVIEKLKERREAGHYAEMRRIEDEEMDDVNMQINARAWRKRAGVSS